MRTRIIIGTRDSELALWQTRWAAGQLKRNHPGLTVDTEIIKTTGDKILDSPLSKIGDKGLFTKEIEIALLDGKIDLAVHSLKDVPTVLPGGLTLGAIGPREDVRDVLITRAGRGPSTLNDLPKGGQIATGSLRRKCQLLAFRPDLRIIDIRGNLNTRFRKLDESAWDGMLLAAAGVRRLGWEDRIAEVISTDVVLPAVGQGAIAVEIREDDVELKTLLQPLHDNDTYTATLAERSLLRKLEGGCQIPVGTLARHVDGALQLDAMVGSLDGTRIIRDRMNGDPDAASELGLALAEKLLSAGAEVILKQIRSGTDAHP
jgi:hydroxymethylbilane synthase